MQGTLITNKAFVTSSQVTNPVGGTSIITVAANNPGLTITKSVNVTRAVVGQNIVYAYQIINTGNVALSGLQASDDKLGPLSLNQTSLAAGQSMPGTILKNYTVTDDDLPGPLTNTVIVTGTPAIGSAITATARLTLSISSDDDEPPEFFQSDPSTLTSLVTPTLQISITLRRPTFNWLAARDNVDVVSYTLILSSSSTLLPTMTVTISPSSYTPNFDLPEGVYTWTVKAYDAAGNVSTIESPENFVIIPTSGEGRLSADSVEE